MADNLTVEDRKRTMRAVKSRLTTPERRMRAMLAGMGVSGWRMNYGDAPGKPDIVFADQKIAIFVDGCFWHGCPICNRPLPKTNHAYWERKVRRNKERDRKYDTELEALGWRTLRIWEHEIHKSADLRPIALRVRNLLAEGA